MNQQQIDSAVVAKLNADNVDSDDPVASELCLSHCVSPLLLLRAYRSMRYSDLAITLNGLPAHIIGFANPFATIRADASGIAFDWCWQSVARIVQHNGGCFLS